MRTKKIIALTLLLMLLLSSVCMAFQPDPNRWAWVSSNDRIGVFYDKQTISYYDYGNTCELWVMLVYPDDGVYSISNLSFAKDRTMRPISFIKYDSNTGKLLDARTFANEAPSPIPPDSFAEILYTMIFSYNLK